MKLNLSEAGRSPGLVGVIESCRQAQHGESGERRRGHLPGNCGCCEVGNRPCCRSTAERTMLELGVAVRMVVRVMRGERGRKAAGAQLHRKGVASHRHEPDRDIGPEGERNEQEPGNQVTAAAMKERSLHKPQAWKSAQ